MACVLFKQKTAYEMLRSLVGSEMGIRDRLDGDRAGRGRLEMEVVGGGGPAGGAVVKHGMSVRVVMGDFQKRIQR